MTGRETYAADFCLPGMAWAKAVRSPFSHARIVSIDTSQALGLPGVLTVLTGADLPEARAGRAFLDLPLLARDKVRFVGERVAAVAAESLAIAEEAARLVQVTYEELPAVFDAVQALKEGAPIVHEDPGSYELNFDPSRQHGDARYQAGDVFPMPNVSSRLIQEKGDIEVGFAQADQVYEDTFRFPAVHQGYIEPRACVVDIERADGSGPGELGKIVVWASNKTPFTAREDLAKLLGVPQDRIRVQVVPVGGDFGGKGMHEDVAISYYLAQRAGRPVKMVMGYTEELMAGNPRHDAVMTLRTGVTGDGEVIAHQARMIFNNGAYAAFRPRLTLPGAENYAGCYRIPHVQREILLVYTNTVPRGHMRSPGGIQLVFATESHMDMIAHRLGLDPLEFRLRNVLVEGDETPLGRKWQNVLAKETLLAATEAANWGSSQKANIGRGIALFDRGPRPRASEARVSIDASGRVTLHIGVPETGVGAHTVLQQIVAEELQVPVSSVSIATGNTDTAPYDGGVGASRVTHTAGGAAAAACRELKKGLVTLAAELWGCEPHEVQLDRGALRSKDGHASDIKELMAKGGAIGRAPLIASGSYDMREPLLTTAFCAQVAEVQVDPETGKVRLLKLINANDVGKVLNPVTLHGQIQGGAVQAMGQALMEELTIEDGSVSSLHLGDYKIPCIADIPQMATVLLESDAGDLPFGGKHVGEETSSPTPAAVVNAVFDAVGIRITDLPVTAEKVYRALREKEAGLAGLPQPSPLP